EHVIVIPFFLFSGGWEEIKENWNRNREHSSILWKSRNMSLQNRVKFHSFTHHNPNTFPHAKQKFPPSSTFYAHCASTSEQTPGFRRQVRQVLTTKILQTELVKGESTNKEFHLVEDDIPSTLPSLFQPIKVHRKVYDRNNTAILNQTVEHFYNVLKKISSSHAIESARIWMKDYEQYRRQVLSEVENENDSVGNKTSKGDLVRNFYSCLRCEREQSEI
ncbi:4027_t:CDS:1, partial [Acaulospora morrowiae]